MGVGMLVLGFPSLLGVYAMAYLYIINVSGWSIETYILIILSIVTLYCDLYYTLGWGTNFKWHKIHVLAHCVFLISEYTATGYRASKTEDSFSFFGIQLVVAMGLELMLFFPHLVFNVKQKSVDQKNMQNGIMVAMFIFGFSFGLDFLIKKNNALAYIPGA